MRTHTTPVNEFIELLVYHTDNFKTFLYWQEPGLIFKSTEKGKDEETRIFYLILQKIITSLCRMMCRDAFGTKTRAPFILWQSIIRISKISCFTHLFGFSLIT